MELRLGLGIFEKCELPVLLLFLLLVNNVSVFGISSTKEIPQSLLEQEELGTQSNQTVKATTNKPQVVELALFCDRDFSSLFQHNNTKILEYWKAMLYDVQLRYDTLSSAKFTFRVTQLLTLEVIDQLLIVDKARRGLDFVSIRHTQPEFSEWVYNKFGKAPNFDIAILAVGAEPWGDITGHASFNRICEIPSFCHGWPSIVAFSVRTSDAAFVLAHEIAHNLGAKHDDAESYLENECGNLPTIRGIMDPGTEVGTPVQRHFFSNCTEKYFFTKYNNFSFKCLQDDKRNTTPIIDTSTVVNTSSISILEQCRVLTNCSSVYVYENETSCSLVVCRAQMDRRKFLNPLNGSPCSDLNGATGTCFRDICMPPGVLLKQSVSGSCLDEDASRNAVSANCSNLLKNPKHFIRIRQNGNNGFWLMKYSWDWENKVQRNCLTLVPDVNNLSTPKFEKCSNNSNMNWNITIPQNQNNLDNFILYHLEARMCLKYSNVSGELYGSVYCTPDNFGVLWKIILTNGNILSHTNFNKVLHAQEAERRFSKEYNFWNNECSNQHIISGFIVLILILEVCNYILADVKTDS